MSTGTGVLMKAPGRMWDVDCLEDDEASTQVLRMAVEPMPEAHLVHTTWAMGVLLEHRMVNFQ